MARKSLWLCCLLPLAATAAEPTTINKVTYGAVPGASAQEKPSLVVDQTLRLKKIFLFPSLDDVKGVVAPKLDEKLLALFRRNTRFEVIQDRQVVKALSPDDNAYEKAATSPEVHREAAKISGADTTVLLRSNNIGSQAELTLELRDANGDLLFSEAGTVPGNASLEARAGLIEKLYRAVLGKLPFEGTVTGRTANTLTIDLGMGDIKQGEEIEIARMVSVQRHPLLKTVIGTDYVRVGKAKISNADKVLSFAQITEEAPGEAISPGNKVLRVRALLKRSTEAEEEAPNPRGRVLRRQQEDAPDPFDERLKGDFDRPKARYGQAGLNLHFGSLAHEQTVSGATTALSGSGIGGSIEGELWVTKNWIARLQYGFHSANLTGNGIVAGDTSWSKLDLYGGYRFFPAGVAEGATVTGMLGYQNMNFAVPAVTAANIGGKTYSGPALRVDGELQFVERQKITGGFGFQPFSTLTESGASLGTASGATVIGFHVGWNYQFADSFWLKVGFQYDSASASYENSTSSVTDKRFAIGPGIYYSF